MKPKKTQEVKPPRWADRLLAWFVAPHLVEYIQGDLHEMFYKRLAQRGRSRAQLAYVLDVLHCLTPFFRRRRKSVSYIDQHSKTALLMMLPNYFKIAFRGFWRNKGLSAIHIMGLALGLTCSLLVLLWVRDEMSMDRYHANGPRIYQLMWRQISQGKRMAMAATPGLASLEFPKKFPEIEKAVSYSDWPTKAVFKAGGKVNKEAGNWAGVDWFRMFSVPLVTGSPETALKSPNSIAISRKLAETYFGSPLAAMGKPVRLDNKNDYQVTAVFEDLPAQSSRQYDYLLAWDDFLRQQPWASDWNSPSPRTYFQLRPDTDMAAFQAKIKHSLRGYLGINAGNAGKFDVELFVQPFEDAYLYDKTENGEISGGRIDYIVLLSLIAGFLLVIACINFVNLSTANAAKRAREVGVRKAVGANRMLLLTQFIGETMLLTCLSVLLALAFVYMLMPWFNQLTGKHLSIPYDRPDFWLGLLCLTTVTGLLSGGYPAIFLSSLKPVRILRGVLTFRPGAARFRQGLVVFQFVLSMLLIISTLVVYRQVDFIQNKSLGFDRENLIYVPLEGTLPAKYAVLKQELEQMPGIRRVARMDYQPGNIGSNTTWVDWPGKGPGLEAGFAQVSVGYEMDKVLKMKCLKGHYFSPEFPTDSSGYVINEQAAKQIGYDDPIGKPLTFWGKPGKIIGVVQDFHFQSMHEAIRPLIMWFGEKNSYGNLLVKTQPGQTKQALASLEKRCRELNPEFPFTYSFADVEYDKMYKSEQMAGQLVNYFAVVAIFIACLGLFGLATFTTQQRTKEIGVRKVLGASVIAIVHLLSGDFLKLVAMAILIASPLGWYLMHRWLTGYAYQTELSWWIFILAGLLAIGVALLTVSFQSIKAALTNPVKSLRAE